MIKIIFHFLFSVLLISCNAQKDNSPKTIKSKLQNADSIILISHLLTEEYAKTVYDWDVRDTSMTLEKAKEASPAGHKFIENGRINGAIILESSRVYNSKDSLIRILTRPPKFEDINKISCDLPQHTIIIYRNGIQSYLDICFTCKKIHASADITFSEVDFDDDKWIQLKHFFQNSGITKEL